MTRRRLACVAAIAVAALGAGAGVGLRSARPPRPPIILISLDTLRADRLGRIANDGRPLMPNLDALARESVTFTGAVAPWPFTLPSHMSMLTGTDPLVHGVLHNRTILPRGIETLAEILHRNGYATEGLVSNEWLEGQFGFSRGFDSYNRIRHGLTYAPRVNQGAFAALSSLAEMDRPFFLFLHYNDAHCDFPQIKDNTVPYFAPREVRQAMGVADAAASYCDEQGSCAGAFLRAANRDRRALPPERITGLVALYDAGVRQLDTDIGDLFAELKLRGVFERALIIVTSDHGEEFREHGLFLHSQPYRETLAVPLLVKLPGGRHADEQVAGLVSLVDLVPTVLDLLRLAHDTPLQGSSLLPAIGKGAPVRREALSRDQNHRRRWALQTEAHKFIWDRETGRVELYDLTSDPSEQSNETEKQPGLVTAMQRVVAAKLAEESRLAAAIPGEHGNASPVLGSEERKRLESLGYVQ